jgi:transposase
MIDPQSEFYPEPGPEGVMVLFRIISSRSLEELRASHTAFPGSRVEHVMHGIYVLIIEPGGAMELGPSMAIEGSTTKEIFETYIEHFLAPVLRPGQVVVVDYLGAHKGGRVRELIESRGCELLYLPPYSPDLNPIEEAFSKVKGLLRRAGSRTRGPLIEAMGRALDAVASRDARGSFEHCGYRLPA